MPIFFHCRHGCRRSSDTNQGSQGPQEERRRNFWVGEEGEGRRDRSGHVSLWSSRSPCLWHIFEREYFPILWRGEAKGGLEEEVRKKEKPDLRKKVMPAVIVRQRKPWCKKDGIYMYFEDNAGVIVKSTERLEEGVGYLKQSSTMAEIESSKSDGTELPWSSFALYSFSLLLFLFFSPQGFVMYTSLMKWKGNFSLPYPFLH